MNDVHASYLSVTILYCTPEETVVCPSLIILQDVFLPKKTRVECVCASSANGGICLCHTRWDQDDATMTKMIVNIHTITVCVGWSSV
mmetsp:Transcript_35682/g.40542  ORF Transcript_35682/g.40542 Transcript_35682/m.40542 type:complete len:87 (+) Transcript_35682:152-412(+)